MDFLDGLSTDNLANITNLNDDSGLLCAELKYDNSWQWVSCLSEERHYFVCQIHKLYHSSSALADDIVYYMRPNNVKLPAMPSFENPIGRGQRTNRIKHEK